MEFPDDGPLDIQGSSFRIVSPPGGTAANRPGIVNIYDSRLAFHSAELYFGPDISCCISRSDYIFHLPKIFGLDLLTGGGLFCISR
jgi:hypothetical protein